MTLEKRQSLVTYQKSFSREFPFQKWGKRVTASKAMIQHNSAERIQI